MVIKLRVLQLWSEIILVISNRLIDFEITRIISDQIAFHSVQLPLFMQKNNYFHILYCFLGLETGAPLLGLAKSININSVG